MKPGLVFGTHLNENQTRFRFNRWILQHRGPKAALDPERPYASLWEEEPDASGALAPTAAIFLTNRECPFRCVMCDLWVNTLDYTVAPGAIARQIRTALQALPRATHIKLYNAGSFFDPRAIPPDDYDEIAELLSDFTCVTVESHPAFLAGPSAERCLRFRDRLHARLEVAVGLETAHAAVLAKLNKGMTLESFQGAAGFLVRNDIGLRVFILLNPPFLPASDGVEWARRSIDVAGECGAGVCAIIPTRGGNGAMEAIGNQFVRPRLPALEAVVEYGLTRGAGGGTGMRVFADLWSIERFFDCTCSPERAARLAHMNRCQERPARVTCDCDSRL